MRQNFSQLTEALQAMFRPVELAVDRHMTDTRHVYMDMRDPVHAMGALYAATLARLDVSQHSCIAGVGSSIMRWTAGHVSSAI